jgi:hypothetical protein
MEKLKSTIRKAKNATAFLWPATKMSVYLSLLSQDRKRINAEIIEDEGRDMLFDDDKEEISGSKSFTCFEKIRNQRQQMQIAKKQRK